MKTCNKCKENKELTSFSPAKESPDGRAYTCINCKRLIQQAARRKKGIKPRRTRNPLHFENGLRECFHCNQILSLDKFSRTIRGDNGYSAYCKECNVKRANRTKLTEYAREWRKDNEDYKKKHCANQQKRKARKLEQDTGCVTTEFMLSLYEENVCSYCNEEIERSHRTIDHVVPLIKGGLHHPDNLVMACRKCNSSKKHMDADEFRRKLNGV